MDYHFKPLGKTCAATGQALVPGSVVWSVLVESGDDLERRDYSVEGWKGPPQNAVAQWKCQVPAPVEVKRKLLDPDALMAFFERLTEEGNPLDDQLRYILAILLMRKRRLRDDGVRQDGETTYLQLTSLQGEGSYEVRDWQLGDAELFELQQLLNARLAAEGSAA